MKLFFNNIPVCDLIIILFIVLFIFATFKNHKILSFLLLVSLILYALLFAERVNYIVMCEQQRAYINYISSMINEIDVISTTKPIKRESFISAQFLYYSYINFSGYSYSAASEFSNCSLGEIKFLYCVNNSPDNFNKYLYLDMVRYFNQNYISENISNIFFADYWHSSKFLRHNQIFITEYREAEKFWESAFRAWNAVKTHP